jgi:hypothetical protein
VPEAKPRARARARVAADSETLPEPTPIAAARKRKPKAAPKPEPQKVEPGRMKRGKLFRLQKGWVFVSPEELPADEREALGEWWVKVSTDPLVVIPSTDLMVDESGRLYVREIAIAFPEEETNG